MLCLKLLLNLLSYRVSDVLVKSTYQFAGVTFVFDKSVDYSLRYELLRVVRDRMVKEGCYSPLSLSLIDDDLDALFSRIVEFPG